MIHSTALIDPAAQLDSTVTVGPYAVIDAHVVLGSNCIVGPYVHLTGHTTIGSHNHFHTGCVIGDEPQDLKYHGEPTRLRIGDHNVFREHANAHRSNNMSEDTVIGSHNFLMANSHVGHNVQVGNYAIISNGVLIAGHAVVGDRVFLSGNSLVHQFVRIGTLAMMQGGAGISLDLPPYTIGHGINTICGLNIVALRRAGFTSEQRLDLKKLYHALFRRSGTMRAALAAAQTEFTSECSRVMLDFVATTKRGVCHDTSHRPSSDSEAC